ILCRGGLCDSRPEGQGGFMSMLLRRYALAAAALGLLIPASAAAEPASLGELLDAAAAHATAPEGSTLVPSRRRLIESLGLPDSAPAAAPDGAATPQALASELCIPDVGTPTTAPSSADGAVGPTHGVIVSNEGILVFDKA